jgi:hypothetical protein
MGGSTAVVRVDQWVFWRDLPPSFGVPFQAAHRRFGQWTKAGLSRRLHGSKDVLGGIDLQVQAG